VAINAITSVFSAETTHNAHQTQSATI
jgi:hypothetical protein